MPVKPILGSYPYLAIARAYNLDYSDVLMLAESFKDEFADFFDLGADPIRGVDIDGIIDKIGKKLDPLNWTKFRRTMLDCRWNFQDIQEEGWDQNA